MLIGSIAITLSISYSAYWAFSIRKALASSLYRRQALGIGLVAFFGELSFVALALVAAYDLNSLLKGLVPPSFQAYGLMVIAFEVALFYWIDSSILAARRSDPLLRDTFSWRRLRPLFWILFLGLEITSIVLPESAFTSGGLSSTAILLVYLPFIIPVVSGVVILPIAARRSGDATLRRHLIWFAFFVAGVFLSGLPNFLELSTTQGFSPANAFPLSLTYLISLIASYFIYRSVKSLAPLNKIPLSD